MVKQDVKFSDGTRIFYEEENGYVQRYIEYAYTPYEKAKMDEDSRYKDIFKRKIRKFKCGKFDYLKRVYGIACGLDDNQKHQLYNELKELHDRVGKVDYSNIVNKDFLHTFGKYWRGNEIQCAAFFVTIYLAMLDLEEGRQYYPNSLGKTMVLKSCEAVILGGKDPREAATMFERKKKTISDDYVDWESDSRYEKYNGYNGYDDDTIDEAFDGHPEATWNVD